METINQIDESDELLEIARIAWRRVIGCRGAARYSRLRRGGMTALAAFHDTCKAYATWMGSSYPRKG